MGYYQANHSIDMCMRWKKVQNISRKYTKYECG